MTRMTLPEFTAALHEADSRYFLTAPSGNQSGRRRTVNIRCLLLMLASASVYSQPLVSGGAGMSVLLPGGYSFLSFF
ncbi:Uncharacterised protein [Salmonella enterica]|uniref:Uncharacterized protein n=1 Tax=Salmonella enterica TaxID=28901 RepID=A0A379QIF1_SALER|nr:Uncharacterised protein [Salmonella enterica]